LTSSATLDMAFPAALTPLDTADFTPLTTPETAFSAALTSFETTDFTPLATLETAFLAVPTSFETAFVTPPKIFLMLPNRPRFPIARRVFVSRGTSRSPAWGALEPKSAN
jgi:hypothetical protein